MFKRTSTHTQKHMDVLTGRLAKLCMTIWPYLCSRDAAMVNANLQVKKLREELAESATNCAEMEKARHDLIDFTHMPSCTHTHTPPSLSTPYTTTNDLCFPRSLWCVGLPVFSL